MRTAWAIYKRELIGTFCSPLAYVVMVAFLVFNGVVFWFFMSMTADNPALTGSRSPLQMFFGSTILSVLTLLVFSPATTMRTFAEERRSRTFETLFTAPDDSSLHLGRLGPHFGQHHASKAEMSRLFLAVIAVDAGEKRVGIRVFGGQLLHAVGDLFTGEH